MLAPDARNAPGFESMATRASPIVKQRRLIAPDVIDWSIRVPVVGHAYRYWTSILPGYRVHIGTPPVGTRVVPQSRVTQLRVEGTLQSRIPTMVSGPDLAQISESPKVEPCA